MGLKLVALIGITLLSSCSSKVISQGALSSVLQDIMSPAKTDKATQIINLAANKINTCPDIARAVFASSDGGLPARIANELPVRPIVARNEPLPVRIIADEMGLPRAIVTNDGITKLISNEPRVFRPEMGYPVQRKLIRQAVREVTPANQIESLVMPNEIYMSAPMALAQESVGYPYRMPEPAPYLPVTALAPNPYLPAAAPAPAPNPYLPTAAPAPAPAPYMPFGAPNPYLPAASPVSAMSPSCMPAPTQSRCQFLRKIPIPPPSL